MVDRKYLTLRGAIYYYKRRYPTHIQGEYGIFFTKSLGTGDIRVARRKRDKMHSKFLSVVEKAEAILKAHEDNEPMVIKAARELHSLKGSVPDTVDGNS
ncbi:MAG: DUF6538 domain-containing protein [Candidatus Thiodiazotropha sp. (ex. Lucinoma kazani)]